MKGSTKEMIKGILTLIGCTLVGSIVGCFAVYFLWMAKSSAWIINNTFFLLNFLGLVIGAVLFIKRVHGPYLDNFNKEVKAEEEKILAKNEAQDLA